MLNTLMLRSIKLPKYVYKFIRLVNDDMHDMTRPIRLHKITEGLTLALLGGGCHPLLF